MKTELRGPHLEYSYRLVDVRELDGERLLKNYRLKPVDSFATESRGAAEAA
jgi:hypothetical protein